MKVERRVHRRVGVALGRHRMAEQGDRILIAVSGGVDSSVLARVLSEKRASLPVEIELLGCRVVTDLAPFDAEAHRGLERFFRDLGVPLARRDVPVIGRMEGGGDPSCFFCAMQRRRELIRFALESSCNKIAYGHHQDDVIQTLLMNMLYKAEISTMPARMELDDHDLVIVRPLCLVPERDVKLYARKFGIEPAEPPCPHAEGGRRQRVGRLIDELAREHPRIRDNLSASLGRVRRGYLREKLRENSGGRDE
ncbi:MAG: ATP-binding protein [Polyangia bacterium]